MERIENKIVKMKRIEFNKYIKVVNYLYVYEISQFLLIESFFDKLKFLDFLRIRHKIF